MRTTAGLGLLLLAAAGGGCFDPNYGDSGATCNAKPRECPEGYVCVPGPEANVCTRAAIAPLPTATVSITPVQVRFHPTGPREVMEVRVGMANFAIDKDAIGQPNEERFGHYHIFLDDLANFSTAAQNYVSGKELLMQLEVSPDAPPFRNAKPGNHTLFISLAHNNHTELSPPVRTQAKFVILP